MHVTTASNCLPDRTNPVGSNAFVDSYVAARTAYHRADEKDRLAMLYETIRNGSTEDETHAGQCAAVLRESWLEEPCTDGVRRGTMFSLLERLHPKLCSRSITDRKLSDFGRLMMHEAEHEALANMVFPRVVYRGGSGQEHEVRRGRSWTLRLETARFFAEEWPARFGNDEPPVVLRMQITHDDVICYLNDREEQEVIMVGRKGEDRDRCIRVS